MSNHGDYWTYLQLRGLSPQTISAYIESVERLEDYVGKPIGEVTPAEAAAFINRPHLSRTSRNAYHRWLSTAVYVGVADEDLHQAAAGLRWAA